MTEETNSHLRAVIFDMDETLIDWSQHNADWNKLRIAHLKPVYDTLAEAGHRLPPLDEVADLYGEFHGEAWRAAEAPHWIAPSQINVLRKTLKGLTLDVAEDEIRALQQRFGWGPIPGVRVFPDAVRVLSELRKAGLRTGLMTNASSPMWMRDRELEALGLLEHLDVRLTAGDVGHLKPHPRAFEAVLEKLGVSPVEAVFVGDQLQDDVAGAQGVGMRAIWVQRASATREGEDISGAKHNGVKPNATINNLSEVLTTLDEWYPGWR
jgi:putative hydrolase of the HAD superfamily